MQDGRHLALLGVGAANLGLFGRGVQERIRLVWRDRGQGLVQRRVGDTRRRNFCVVHHLHGLVQGQLCRLLCFRSLGRRWRCIHGGYVRFHSSFFKLMFLLQRECCKNIIKPSYTPHKRSVTLCKSCMQKKLLPAIYIYCTALAMGALQAAGVIAMISAANCNCSQLHL